MSAMRFFTFNKLLDRSGRCFLPTVQNRFLSLKLTAKIDKNNVISSPLPHATGFEGVLLHEYISQNIDKWHDRTAVECAFTGRRYTYDQLRKLSGYLATSLMKCNVQPGDTIATILPNIPEYALIIMGSSKCGTRLCSVNPAYTVEEIRRQLLNSNAVAVITTPSKYNDVQASIQRNPNIRLPIIVVNDQTSSPASGALKFEELMRDDVGELPENTRITTEDDVLLPYSSGTTGLPKGVCLSHRNVVANLAQTGNKSICTEVETTESHQDVVPIILPLYHIYGTAVVLLKHLRVGAKLVCMPQFSVPRFIKLLEEYQPHVLYLVPPLIQMMANTEEIKRRHLDRTRLVMSGAAPIGAESIEQFQRRISSSLVFVQGYGLTETGPVITLSRTAARESCGYIVPSTQIRIVDPKQDGAMKNLDINECGEIFVRGPQVMKGYYNNPQATANTMDGDWFKTGDLGYCNSEGLLYVTGRLKELIKVKGYQVSPTEVEEVIRGLDKVLDVAVIGVPDEKLGEVPKAFIVPKQNSHITEDEIKAHVAKQLAKYKQVGHIQFIDAIPKSAAGKILRRELKN